MVSSIFIDNYRLSSEISLKNVLLFDKTSYIFSFERISCCISSPLINFNVLWLVLLYLGCFYNSYYEKQGNCACAKMFLMKLKWVAKIAVVQWSSLTPVHSWRNSSIFKDVKFFIFTKTLLLFFKFLIGILIKIMPV